MLVNVGTGQAQEKPVNSRLANVAISRVRYDAQIYTDNSEGLGDELSRDVSKRAALEAQHELSRPERTQAIGKMQHQEKSRLHGQGYGYGIGRCDETGASGGPL